jgi:hypothetical protein
MRQHEMGLGGAAGLAMPGNDRQPKLYPSALAVSRCPPRLLLLLDANTMSPLPALCFFFSPLRLQAHILEQEVSAIVFGGAPPQLNANGGGGGGGGGGGQGQPFAPCRECGAQLQLVLNAEGPPSILCSAYPMHRLRIDLPRCTSAVAISGQSLLPPCGS